MCHDVLEGRENNSHMITLTYMAANYLTKINFLAKNNSFEVFTLVWSHELLL